MNSIETVRNTRLSKIIVVYFAKARRQTQVIKSSRILIQMPSVRLQSLPSPPEFVEVMQSVLSILLFLSSLCHVRIHTEHHLES